jgi:hypothetical protein
LKIAECLQSDFLKWLEQFAICKHPAWPLFQPQVAEVRDPGGSPLLRRRCGAHTACHTQASNPLDMTKQWSDVFFSTKLMLHKSSVYPMHHLRFQFSDLMFFLFPYGIASIAVIDMRLPIQFAI